MNNLNVTIFPYLLKEFLIYCIYFLAVTVLVLFIILVIHKLHIERREKKKQKYTSEYMPLISQYIDGGSLKIKQPENNLQYNAFADVCINMFSKVPEEKKEKLKMLIRETSALEHYKRRAASSSWTKRFFAVEMLGFFMIDDLKGFFKNKIDSDQSPEVKVKAIWAMSLIADEKALDFITQMLVLHEISSSSKFNEYIYTNVIGSLKKRGTEHVFLTFLGQIKADENIPMLLKRDMIEACGSAGFYEASSAINDYFTFFSHESLMKIACIRALGAVDRLKAKTIVTGLIDDDWRTRAVAAKAASVGFDNTVISHLQKSLYDQVYIVRINAARTLSRLDDQGLAVLKGEMNSEDRFVRDTIRYILDERGSYA
jgi:hypothetical protein